jgi:hypothetical protein
LPVLHAHELLLAAAEQARVGDDVIVETLNASLLEGFSYFFRGLPIVGGLVALSTLISNQVANQVTQVGGSIVSIMGYACHMYRYTHRRKFLFLRAQVTNLKAQLKLQEEKLKRVEIMQEEKLKRVEIMQEEKLKLQEEKLKRVQIEAFAESRKQILDFITTSGYQGLRELVEVQNEKRKRKK